MVAAHQSGESKGRLKRKALQTDLIYQVLRSMKALPALAAKLRTARLKAPGWSMFDRWLASGMICNRAPSIARHNASAAAGGGVSLFASIRCRQHTANP